MAVDFPSGARRMYFRPISWQAIFAGLTVGIALQLFLMLAGVAVGGLVVEPGADTARQMSASVGIWSGISMLIAAFVGGYVASRSSGLRRKGDGILHGVVTWGTSTLLFAFLAGTVLSTATAGLFNQLRPMVGQVIPQSIQQNPQRANRQDVAQTLRNLGLSDEQIQNVMNQVDSVAQSGAPTPQARATMESTADRVGVATGGLTLAVLLSLIAGILGGLSGTMGQRRVRRHQLQMNAAMNLEEARVLTRPIL